MMRKRAATLSLAEPNGGLLRAVDVLKQALVEACEGLEVRTPEVLPMTRWWFRRYCARLLAPTPARPTRIPRLRFQRRRRKHHGSVVRDWVIRGGAAGVLRTLGTLDPHLVLVTDFAAAAIAALAKREGRVSASILAVQTDFGADPAWAQRDIDAYCVASEEARSQLIRKGVSPHRVVLCGVPVDPAFSLPFDKPETLTALGLDTRAPVVLVVGEEPYPALDRLVGCLELCGGPVQVVAVTGDQAMRACLEGMRSKLALTLHVFAWTDNLPELMAAADLLVGRPTGVLAAEALAAGLPMVLTPSMESTEQTRSCWLEENGVAVRAGAFEEVPQWIHRLLTDPERLAKLRRRARDLARPDAAHSVAQVARALLETSTYIDLLSTPPLRGSESAYLM